MSRRRWVLLTALAVVVLLGVAVVWSGTRPSESERYAATIVVDGYRKTATEFSSKFTVVTFWTGPASSAPEEAVVIPGVAWVGEPYPPNYKHGVYAQIDSARGSKWYGNIDSSAGRCSAFIDRLVLNGRDIVDSEVSRWEISGAEAASIERGESALLAVGVACWDD